MTDLPETIYIGDGFTEDYCSYCGEVIFFNTLAVYDPVLDSWYCNNECRNGHLKAEPQLMELLEEDDNG